MPPYLPRLIATTLGSLIACTALAGPDAPAGASPGIQPVRIGSLTIGQGQPRIIVSTTGANEASVLKQAQAIADTPEADILELRVDTLDFATDAPRVAALGRKVAAQLKGKPLLLTFRTKGEGGSRALPDDAYAALNSAWLAQPFAQLIDIEIFRGEERVRQLVAQAHAKGVEVILSSHQLDGTPSNEAMLQRLARQEALGADILKLAVMPGGPEDVSHLLTVTAQMRARTHKPLLTMAMGGTGAVSRVAGEAFGSALTFGALGAASAPGQLDVKALRGALDMLHQASAREG